MATIQDFEQLQAFARIDGATVAVLWLASFACFIGQFQYQMLGMGAFIIGASSLVLASLRVRKFRDNILNGIISYRHAFAYGLMIYFYASLLFAACQFIYFQFMDNGMMMSNYYEIVNTKEYKQMMSVYGLTESDIKLAMENITSMRPIEIAFQFFTMNIIMGTAISIPVAMIMKKTFRTKKP